jgi:hypothetical protein
MDKIVKIMLRNGSIYNLYVDKDLLEDMKIDPCFLEFYNTNKESIYISHSDVMGFQEIQAIDESFDKAQESKG